MAEYQKRYNRTYTVEKFKQVNPESIELLNDYLLELRAQKKSLRTIKAYEDDLKIVLCHIHDAMGNKSVLDMTKRDWRGLTLWLSEGMGGNEEDSAGRSNARVNRMRSACNGLMNFAEDSDDYDYDINYSAKVKGLPQERVKTNEGDFFFSYKEFVEMRKRLIELGEIEIASWLSVAFDSGARRQELVQVEKYSFLNNENRTNVVVGKRRKKFSLIYLNDTKDIVQQWLAVRGEDDIDAAWTVGDGEDRKSVTGENLYAWAKKCSKILSEIRGEETSIFVHTIRHSRAEALSRGEDDRLLDADGNNRKYSLEEIAVLLHHDDVSTTKGYLKDHTEEIENELFGF